MSTKIKITSIKIENYRQYFGSQTVDFPSREDGFSVIVGENGAGKSNLLNALNWCFYKKEPHTKNNKGYGIVNHKYLSSVENGGIAEMRVQVELQKGNDNYRISRVLKVIKNEYQYEDIDSVTQVLRMTSIFGFTLPAGCEVMEHQSTFEILVKKEHEADFHRDRNVNADVIMNQILPESLSSYFILDGEFLEKFWSGITVVQKGVEQISQLHLINTTMKHIDQLKRSVPQIGDKEIDNCTTKMKSYDYFENSQDAHGNEIFSDEPRYKNDPDSDGNDYYHASGQPLIHDLEEDRGRMKSDLQSIIEKLGSSGVADIQSLSTRLKQLEEDHRSLSKKEEDAERQYFSSMIENLPLLFLKPAIEQSIRLVDVLRAKGELPYSAKKIFTNDLLERGTCICCTDLTERMVDGKESNNARLEVMKVRDSMAEDQGLDGSIDMKFHFEEKLLGDFDGFTESAFDKPRKSFSTAKADAEKCNEELKGITTKLQNIGDENIEDLARNHEHKIRLIQNATTRISDIRSELKENKRQKQKLEMERRQLLNKNKKSQKIAHTQRVWDVIYSIFEQTYFELRDEIRDEVQDKTLEIFLKTMYKDDLFKKFVIKDNYEVELIDQKDVSILGSLSAGESLFLALSFISAIRNVTGFKFPLVIDTPLGRVSGAPRYLLSQALPKYLPDEQIIFLATDTEFLNPDANVHDVEGRPNKPFGQLLEDRIGVRYYLIEGVERNTAKITKYEPKWRNT